MKSIALILLTIALPASAAPKTKITYFSCPVKEGRTIVTVKFAIKNLDPSDEKGELIQYPGSSQDEGMISVEPKMIKKNYTKMSNLNGQGGDLTIRNNGNIFLFGDGDGYQFTDLELWYDNADMEETTKMEGYVRDYGNAYDNSNEEHFKQFIKCVVSNKVL